MAERSGTSQLAADGRTAPGRRRRAAQRLGGRGVRAPRRPADRSARRPWRHGGSVSRRASCRQCRPSAATSSIGTANPSPTRWRKTRSASIRSELEEPARRRSRASVARSGTARANAPGRRRDLGRHEYERPLELSEDRPPRGRAREDRRAGGRVGKKPALHERCRLILEKKPRRIYPNKELAASVLGFVGEDNDGLAGLEHAVRRPAQRDSPAACWCRRTASEAAFSRVGAPPVPGKTIELTIDAILQAIVERELRGGCRGEPRARRLRRSSWIRRPARSSRWRASRPSTRTPSRACSAERRRNRAGAGHLRARIDVQDRDRVGGARRRRSCARPT